MYGSLSRFFCSFSLLIYLLGSTFSLLSSQGFPPSGYLWLHLNGPGSEN